MQLTGEYRIPAPRERVWEMLNDPDVLRASIPGCESLEAEGSDKFKAKVTAKVGPVKATFSGEVTLEDLNPPESYRIVGEGKGGVAGFAKGGADVNLAEDGADTLLSYTVDAQVGGKLAQIGGRLIDSTARKMADQFFGSFSKLAAGPADADKDEGLIESTVHAVEEAAADVIHSAEDAAHKISDAAHEAEESLERQAAAGTLGGPIVWALLILAAIIVFYIVVT